MSFAARNTLLVPMGLKAMVMPAQDQDGGQGWDRRQLDYAKINAYQSPVPPVFGGQGLQGTGTPPPTGVHLYWSLPQALTKALTQQEVEILRRADGGALPTGAPPYPLVPNRWMVLRIQQDTNGGPAQIASWVINSDEMDPDEGQSAYVDPFNLDAGNVVNPVNIGVARRIEDWLSLAQGSGFANVPPRPFLTAMGPGTGTFNAFTPGASNVFSFCDPLEDDGTSIESATLNYAVLGWYSAASADPLNPDNPVNAEGFSWVPVDAAALPPEFASQAEDLSWVQRLGWVANLAGDAAPEHTMVQAMIEQVVWERNAPLPTPPEFQSFSSTAQNVRVALANTSAEGISAMVYEELKQSGTSTNEAAQTALEIEALQYRALRHLDDPAGRHVLADRIKRSTYATAPGGFVWEVLATESDAAASPLSASQAESLARLNQNQRALDEARAVLSSMQMRLYDLWWKQQSIAQSLFAPPPNNAPYFGQYVNAQTNLEVPRGQNLSAPVAAYQAQVEAQVQRVATLQAALPPTDGPQSAEEVENFAAGFLDPSEQRLVAVPMPGYFAPTDPVVVVAGAGRLADPQPAIVLCETASAVCASAKIADPIPEAALAMRDLAESGGRGYSSSAWQQPWAPLFLDWQISYNYVYTPGAAVDNTALTPTGHYAVDQQAWEFDGRDYRWAGGALGAAGGSLQSAYANSYQGRTFFSPHGKRNFAAQLGKLAQDYGALLPETPSQKIEAWSLLSQSTSGFTQLLAMRDTAANASPGSAVSKGMPDTLSGVPAPWLNPTPYLQDNQTGTPYFFPLRAGFISLVGLQLTDSFGRTMNLMSANHGSTQDNPILKPLLPPTLTPPKSAQCSDQGMAVLAPRLVQPARLALRFVDATDDSLEVELTPDGNPICGWLLPNHADGSLAVYNQGGAALGALQPYLLSGGGSVLQWIPAPGGMAAPANPATEPEIENTQLAALVNGILDAADPVAAMQDIMLTLDQSAWTLDPGEERSGGSIAALIGHPIAVVRANLQLQLQGLAKANQSYEQIFKTGSDQLKFNSGGVEELKFEVKLGAIELRGDGIAGYYLGSDYGAMMAVHRPPQASSGYISQQGETRNDWPIVSPVETPEASDGTMDTQGSVYVTLLVDPRGDLHATSGLLPRVRRGLPEKAVAQALSQMAISMQVGPLLLNTGAVEMPLPSVQSGKWSWLTATGTAEGDWQTDHVKSSDATARPMADAPILQDGWLLLTPSTAPNEED